MRLRAVTRHPVPYSGKPVTFDGNRRLYAQALNDASVHQVFLNDFVDVVLVYVCIPDPFGVHDDGRALLASVQAARHVDPNLTRTGKT